MNGFTLKDFVAQEAIALEANLTLGGNFKVFAETGIAMFASTITSAGRSHLLFMANYSLVRKALIQAMLSALRQHRVQMNGNLRQAIEGATSMAYLIAHPSPDFLRVEQLKPNAGAKLNEKSRKWLNEKYPDRSAVLKVLKDEINATDGHSNITNSAATFDFESINQPRSINRYLDRDDTDVLEVNLWTVGHFAVHLMSLLAQSAADHEGINIAEDIDERIAWMSQRNDELSDEMATRPKWKDVFGNAGEDHSSDEQSL